MFKVHKEHRIKCGGDIKFTGHNTFQRIVCFMRELGSLLHEIVVKHFVLTRVDEFNYRTKFWKAIQIFVGRCFTFASSCGWRKRVKKRGFFSVWNNAVFQQVSQHFWTSVWHHNNTFSAGKMQWVEASCRKLLQLSLRWTCWYLLMTQQLMSLCTSFKCFYAVTTSNWTLPCSRTHRTQLIV